MNFRISSAANLRPMMCVLAFFFAGCMVQKGGVVQPKKDDGTLVDVAYRSFLNREKLRSEKLNRVADDIKSGKLKYDGPVMAEIEKSGAEASQESWKPVAARLGQILNSGGTLDAAKAEKAIRDVAAGAAKVGGK